MRNRQETKAQELVKRMLRIVVVDDHPMIRQGVRCVVDHETDMQVVGEAEGGNQSEHVIRDLIDRDVTPDVVVMDISMPDGNGVEATARVRHCFPQMNVLVFSMHEESYYLRSLIESGASGYVSKRSAVEELIRAIRIVAGGDVYVDPALMNTAIKLLFRARPTSDRKGIPPKADIPESVALSDRQESVLRKIAQGYTSKEIGMELEIGVKTVETYKARAMEKLGLEGRVDLVRYAVMRGWLS